MTESIRIAVPESASQVEFLVTGILEDLEISATVEVVAGPFEINDRRLVLNTGDNVVDAVFRNREFLIGERIAAEMLGVGSSPELLGLARDLVRHGIKVSRVHGLADSLSNAFEAAYDEASVELTVRISKATLDGLTGQTRETWDSNLEMMREGLFYELGLMFGVVLVHDEKVPDAAFRVQINDLRGPIRELISPTEFLVNDLPDRLAELSVTARPANNPANGTACAIIDGREHANTCEAAGLTTWDMYGCWVLSLAAEIRQRASSLFPISIVELMMESIKSIYPVLTARVNDLFSIAQLASVLRLLVQERVSVRNLRAILEPMSAMVPFPTGVDFAEHIVFTYPGITGFRPSPGEGIQPTVERVRMALQRQLSRQHSRGGNTLVVYLLDPQIELALTSPNATLGLQLRETVAKEIASLPTTAQTPVILTSANVRASCVRVLETDFPHLAVLSYQELSPDLDIRPLARISLDD